DGTLISSGGAGAHAFFQTLLDEFALEQILGQVCFSGRTDRAILRDLFELHQIDNSPENWERFRRVYLRQLPTSLREKGGRILPGVLELLEQLQQRDDVTVT